MLYNRSLDAYLAAAAADLHQSLVFVQLLGPYVTPKAPDLPHGYEGLQLDIAEVKQYQERIPQSEAWITKLQANQNPFTTEVLQQIRDQ